MLFYVYPLLLSIVLYGLIAKALLSKSRNKFPGGRDDQRSKAAIKTNQSRVQVSFNFRSALFWSFILRPGFPHPPVYSFPHPLHGLIISVLTSNRLELLWAQLFITQPAVTCTRHPGSRHNDWLSCRL